MNLIPIIAGLFLALAMVVLALSQPVGRKPAMRRLEQNKMRHGSPISAERELRKLIATRQGESENRLLNLWPNRGSLANSLARTGFHWTVNDYIKVNVALIVAIAALLAFIGLPPLMIGMIALGAGLGLPSLVVKYLMARRIRVFTMRFPEAIELMVRGLRSGLPVSKTLQIVASELTGPVSEEFQVITDSIKIGRTMDEALQLVADRLNISDFQFFCISIAIQRETGGNLAETLANLASLLRKRAQMRLKIKALSAETRASAAIIGAMPFVIFGVIYSVNPEYMGQFFIDPRLIIVGIGAIVWMSLGGIIMAKMASFEI